MSRDRGAFVGCRLTFVMWEKVGNASKTADLLHLICLDPRSGWHESALPVMKDKSEMYTDSLARVAFIIETEQ